MHRLVVIALLLVIAPAVASAQPRSRAWFVDGVVGIGGMRDAPADSAGLVGADLRVGRWLPESRFGLEAMVGATWVRTPEPADFSDRYFRDTEAYRVRAMLGARVTTDRREPMFFVARLAVGVERISLSTTESGDVDEVTRSGSDVAPIVELSGGCLIGGARRFGIEVGVSRVVHDGEPVSGFDLGYRAIELELRLVAHLGS